MAPVCFKYATVGLSFRPFSSLLFAEGGNARWSRCQARQASNTTCREKYEGCPSLPPRVYFKECLTAGSRNIRTLLLVTCHKPNWTRMSLLPCLATKRVQLSNLSTLCTSESEYLTFTNPSPWQALTVWCCGHVTEVGEGVSVMSN